jgi:DNA-binding response OmpR family regulator
MVLLMNKCPLLGLRVLLVEDDPIIALGSLSTLAEAGAEVVGPAYTVAQALALIENRQIDAAILDYRLEAETASRVAVWLSARNVPFLFYTSTRAGAQQEHPGIPIVDKPARPEELVAAIRALTIKLSASR